MFGNNKYSYEEEYYDPPVPTKKATKLILKNNNTKKISFAQTTTVEESVSKSDSNIRSNNTSIGFSLWIRLHCW